MEKENIEEVKYPDFGKKPDISLNARNALVKEAKLSGYWIYSNRSKKWYTPDEFWSNGNEMITHHRGEANIKDYRILDPRLAIDARLQAAIITLNEVIDLKKRIDDYYEMRSKKYQRTKFI